VIRLYDEAGNVIETHENAGDFKSLDCSFCGLAPLQPFGGYSPLWPFSVPSSPDCGEKLSGNFATGTRKIRDRRVPAGFDVNCRAGASPALTGDHMRLRPGERLFFGIKEDIMRGHVAP
jgi:hypothetical protein